MKQINCRKEDFKPIVKYEPVLNSICFKGLNPLELNVFFAMLYRLKDNETNEVSLTFDEIKTLSQYNKSKRDPSRFKNHLQNVYNKILKIDFRIDTDEVEGFANLFSHFLISKTEPTITMQINKDFAYIFNELSIYTSFDLLEYTSLKSAYSKKVFTLIKQFEKTGWYEIKYQEFKELLDVPKSYYPKDVERQILKPVETELSQYFKKFKYIKKMFGSKINSIKFTWDITKPVVEIYEKPVNPKIQKTVNNSKFNKNLPVVNRATEKSAIEYSQKHEQDLIKSDKNEKELNKIYKIILELSLEEQKLIEKKAYSNFLKESGTPDNKLMQGIFEKTKKVHIVKEYQEYIEKQENIEENEISEEPELTPEKILVEESKQSLENFEEENPIGWEQKMFVIHPPTELEIEADNLLKTMFPFLEEELYIEDIDYIRVTLKRKKMFKELEFFDTFLKRKKSPIVDSINIFKDSQCLGFSEFGRDYIENYIKEHHLEHLVKSKSDKELKGSARENRLIKLYKNNFKII